MKPIISVSALVSAVFMASQALAWPQDQARIGAENHPKILAQQGGEIKNKALVNYVRRVGDRIVAQTPLAQEPWVFTVTDTPVVNAFAAPGGYVYITRGLLALANSEAELAAVIGHEVAHLTAAHHQQRAERNNNAGLGVIVGTVIGGILGGKDGLKKGIELSSKVATGYVSQFSQSQEFEADALGTQYLAAAGYNPLAQSAILRALSAKRAFEAKKTGQAYNPNRVDFFATHPATEDRVRRVTRVGNSLRSPDAQREAEAPYMNAIDGMVYGDSAEQGFVRGKTFAHPVIGFEYSVPDSFTITNSAQRIVSKGPNGAQFNLDGGGKANGTPEEHLRNVWIKQIARDVEIGPIGQVTTYAQNGIRAAHATVPYTRDGVNWRGHLTVIHHRDGFIRLSGLAPASDAGVFRQFDAAARSFRALTAAEAAQLRPYRLRSYEVQSYDNVQWLAMGGATLELPQELFLTLNGMDGPQDLFAGDLVKVVTE